MSITLKEYYMGRDLLYDLKDEYRNNANETILKVGKLLDFIVASGVEVEPHPKTGSIVTSGWRPAEVNSKVSGAAPRSKHITCQAVDIYDPEGDIDNFLTDEILEKYQLYREHPSATKGWVHLQIVPPRSGKRTFYP